MKIYTSFTRSVFTALFFCLSVLSVMAQRHDSPPPASPQAGPPAVKPGLQITRAALIKKINSSDIIKGLVFKPAGNVDKLPNYVAVDSNKSTIQLLGKPDELILAKWVFILNIDPNINAEEVKKMAWFAAIMGEKEGLDWFMETTNNLGKNFNKEFTEAKVLDYNRKGEIKYNPDGKIYTLSFKTW